MPADILKKPLKAYKDFIAADGVMKSDSIHVFGKDAPTSNVQAVRFLYAPWNVINNEFPVENYGHSQYILEIDLTPHTPLNVRDDIIQKLKGPVEFRNESDLAAKHEVNVYVPEDELAQEDPTVVLIAMGNADTLIEYLETRNLALGKADGQAIKMLHEKVWPDFKAKHTKKM